MKVIAIIPARGGSKGIPKKNIVNFKKKPLIVWSVEAALNSKFVTDVYVSSDDDEILKISKISDQVNTIKRPAALAQDNSKTEPVLAHVLNSIDSSVYDYLILLQPTSPLRTAAHIDAAFSKLLKSEADSLISISELKHHPLKTFTINPKGFLEGIINNKFPFTPRQSLPKVFRANGAIYIIEIASFLKKNVLITNKTTHFLMDMEESVDIDCNKDVIQ